MQTTPHKREQRRWSWFVSTGALILLFAGWWRLTTTTAFPAQTLAATNETTPHGTANYKLLSLFPAPVGTSDEIAVVNLHCAEGLPGMGDINARSQLSALNRWAGRVKSETERHLYRFRANPAQFEHSEGYYRMLMMAVVLYEDFGVRYNPQLASAPQGNAADYSFFANPRDVFIHGLLSDGRTGTCSSMPYCMSLSDAALVTH